MDGSDPALGEVLQVMRLLWALDHHLQLTSKRMVATLGVTGPQRLVIRLIGRFPGISAGRLATALHLHPSTLTGVLKRLEKRGLIGRQADPEDGRRALFVLTDQGKKLDVPSPGTVETALSRAIQNLPKDRVESVKEALAVFAQELEANLQQRP
jgi:MarR family transcriptional regulator, organic hydroperoxide resistance regulator